MIYTQNRFNHCLIVVQYYPCSEYRHNTLVVYIIPIRFMVVQWSCIHAVLHYQPDYACYGQWHNKLSCRNSAEILIQTGQLCLLNWVPRLIAQRMYFSVRGILKIGLFKKGSLINMTGKSVHNMYCYKLLPPPSHIIFRHDSLVPIIRKSCKI